MKTRLAAFFALLIAASAFADANYNIVKQRARAVSDQNNAEQGRIQKATAATEPTPAPMDPALQATLQNISDLQGNFTAFTKADGAPDTNQKNTLLNNLSQAAQGTKAASADVKKLADDLVTALAGKNKLTVPQLKKLAVSVHALFNSSHLNAAQQKTMLDDVQKILTEAGVSDTDATNVVADLKKITEETAK
jgi:flagellar motor protein MotB